MGAPHNSDKSDELTARQLPPEHPHGGDGGRGPSAGPGPDRPGSAPSDMTKGYGGGMADHEDWTPGDVASMVANPFYAINIDEGLALPHEPLISEDDWVRANVGLIGGTGPGSLRSAPRSGRACRE